jgi:hypothetical protein
MRVTRGLTVVAANERLLVVGFLAFQVSRLRRGNIDTP